MSCMSACAKCASEAVVKKREHVRANTRVMLTLGAPFMKSSPARRETCQNCYSFLAHLTQVLSDGGA